MEWKNGTLRSMLKGNKEKVIFLFCSGLLLFVISLPNGKTTDSGLRAGTVEVVADVSGDDESTALEDAGEEAAAKEESGSYEEKLEQRIRELLKSVDGVGEAEKVEVSFFNENGEEVSVSEEIADSFMEQLDVDKEVNIVSDKNLRASCTHIPCNQVKTTLYGHAKVSPTECWVYTKRVIMCKCCGAALKSLSDWQFAYSHAPH